MNRPAKDPRVFDDQVPQDLPPATLSENARIVLAKRYLKKDEAGEPTEDPETMFWRIAGSSPRRTATMGPPRPPSRRSRGASTSS